MKIFRLLLAALFIFSFTLAEAGLNMASFEMSGYLKNEVSMGLQTFNDVSKIKNIISLSGEYVLNDNWVAFMSVRGWYDFIYDIRDKYDPAQHYMGHTQRIDWLRDCYLDYNNGPWFLRLGRQQVSWGQSDGVPILDRVNPFDLTEYWLQDFVDMRIPLWMLNINYAPKLNSNLQFLIIPEFEQSTAAPPSAPFSFRSYRLFDTFKSQFEAPPLSPNKFPLPTLPVPTNYNGRLNTNIYYPSKELKNSKFGLQWKDRIADWDYTLNYLYGFDYAARTYRDSVSVVPVAFPLFDATFNYSRRFKRVHLVGASLNHSFTEEGPLNGITLRSDLAFYLNEPTYFGNVVTGSSAGTKRWNNIFWLIGLDKYVVPNWLVSFQFAQYIMQDAKPGGSDPNTGEPYKVMNAYTYGAQDQVENIFSLKVMTDFMHDRLKTEVLWSATDDNQGRISPKATYEIKDDLWLTLGVHHFYGREEDSNGQFRDMSQIYTHLKFTF
jgi:hypothetical protein